MVAGGGGGGGGRERERRRQVRKQNLASLLMVLSVEASFSSFEGTGGLNTTDDKNE